MARITVEDCLKQIPNRFELVMVASELARRLKMGESTADVSWDGDKPTVVALRQIADHGVASIHFDSNEDIDETDTTETGVES